MSPERWRRIEELFVEAEPLAPSERDALLDRACAGDDELRRELEALLADTGGDTAPFAGPVAGAAAALAEPPRPTSSAAASAPTGSPPRRRRARAERELIRTQSFSRQIA